MNIEIGKLSHPRKKAFTVPSDVYFCSQSGLKLKSARSSRVNGGINGSSAAGNWCGRRRQSDLDVSAPGGAREWQNLTSAHSLSWLRPHANCFFANKRRAGRKWAAAAARQRPLLPPESESHAAAERESEVLRGARSRMIKRFGASHSLSSLRRGGKRSRARPPALAARHRAGHAAAGQKMKLQIDTHTHAEFRYLSFARACQPTTAAGRKFAPRVFNFQPRSAQLHMRARNAGLWFGHQLLVACCPCLEFYQPRSSIKNGRDHRFEHSI